MPGIIIHTLLGSRLLDRWTQRPAEAPFSPGDPEHRNTFLSGCSGPDMGMYPGGKWLFSNLAHYVHSGELTRNLVREARNDVERAFGWGWATHVLADALIHPLINLAAGEVRGCAPLTYYDDPSLHLAVEYGADGSHFSHWQKLGLGPFPYLPRSMAGYVSRAFQATYGPAVREIAIESSLVAWGRFHGFIIALAGAASRKLYGHSASHKTIHNVGGMAATFLSGTFARHSPLYGATHPIAPSPKVVSLIEQTMDHFLDLFCKLQSDNLAALPDYNLDTGEVEDPPTYPLAVRTLRQRRDALKADAFSETTASAESLRG
jgi:hypothetical protein